MPVVEGLVWDDENEEEVWHHGLEPSDVASVFEAGHALFKNKRHRRGLFQVVGKDAQGRYLTVIIQPTRDRTLWRVVTGWPSSTGEITKAKQQGIR